MIRKIISVLLVLGLLVSLCGCDFLTADTAELLSPPQLSGDLAPIAQAISESEKNEYKFQYPSRGHYRSAVVQEDINSDGSSEAFAFYSTDEGETTTMNINAIVFDGKKWCSIAQQKIVAGGVDSIEFCDLDGDAVKEILVGWQIYGTSEMQLAVYSLGENSLTQRMFEKYTHFTTCDLDEDGEYEVLVIKSGSIEEVSVAQLYTLTNDGITQLASCNLDKAAKTLNQPIVANLSNGKPAVYIDEIKGVGAVTEVLFMDKDSLVNPLLENETGENIATLHSPYLNTTDINKDGIMEIPIQWVVPSVTKSNLNEKLYLTDWCSFNGEMLVSQMTTMNNMEDGYYYIIPSKLKGNIAILKDTENKLREIYKYNAIDMTIGEKLIYFKTEKISQWDKEKHKETNALEIIRDNKYVYICEISSAAKKEGITIENIKSSFFLVSN